MVLQCCSLYGPSRSTQKIHCHKAWCQGGLCVAAFALEMTTIVEESVVVFSCRCYLDEHCASCGSVLWWCQASDKITKNHKNNKTDKQCQELVHSMQQFRALLHCTSVGLLCTDQS